MKNRTLVRASAALCLAFASLACSDDPTATTPPAALEILASSGPYDVASVDLTFVDESRPTDANRDFPGAPSRTLASRVWYPTSPAEPAAGRSANDPAPSGGPFPLIGYAHGFTSQKGEGALLGRHLASHGYVVVAPDFPLSHGGAPGGPTSTDLVNQPADLGFVMQSLAAAGHPIASDVDRERFGIAGLSMGAGTVMIAAYHPTLRLDFVASAVALAPYTCEWGPGFYARDIPMLIVGATADALVFFAENPLVAFERAPRPVTLVRLEGGTHSGMLGVDLADGRNTDLVITCNESTEGEIDRRDPAAVRRATEIFTRGLPAGGLDPDGCSVRPCDAGVVEAQSMRGARQLDLVRAAALAHFEATLRGRRDDAAFLERGLREGSDVEVLAKR